MLAIALLLLKELSYFLESLCSLFVYSKNFNFDAL